MLLTVEISYYAYCHQQVFDVSVIVSVHPCFLINEMERKNKIENSMILRAAHLINKKCLSFGLKELLRNV